MDWNQQLPTRYALLLPVVALIAGVGSFLIQHDFDLPDGSVRQIVRVESGALASPQVELIQLGTVDLPGSAISLTVAGNALHACLSAEGLATINVSNPADPWVTQHLPGALRPSDLQGKLFLSVLAEDGRLIVADRLRGLAVYDAADPLRPNFLWARRFPGSNNDQPASILKLDDGYYLSCGGGGLRRLPNDFGPETIAAPLITQFDHTRQTLLFSPRWLLVADGYDTGMQVVDLKDRNNPRLAHIFQLGTFCDQIVAVQPFVVLANRTAGFTIADLSDPERPSLAAYHYTSRARSIVKSLAVWRGQYLLVANAFNFIDVYDMKNPRRPVRELRMPMPGDTNVILVDGDILYASFWNQDTLSVFQLKLTEAVS